MMRQFGVVLGPVLIFGLKFIDFQVQLLGFEIHVTEYSAPGLVMGKITSLITVVKYDLVH